MAGKRDDIRSSLIAVIQNPEQGGLESIAVAADVIAADARFNLWVARVGKKQTDSERMVELAELYEATIEKCCAGVRQFKESGSAKELNIVLQEIAVTLRDAVGSFG
jgi:hypothetical protein